MIFTKTFPKSALEFTKNKDGYKRYTCLGRSVRVATYTP
jgi:hypothetical protein